MLHHVVCDDGHYGRHEAMSWCARNRVGYVFGLGSNTVLLGRVSDLAEDAAMDRLAGEADKVRRFGGFRYAARTWKVERRVIAGVEASAQGTEARFTLTNLAETPKALYETISCAHGRMEAIMPVAKRKWRLGSISAHRMQCSQALLRGLVFNLKVGQNTDQRQRNAQEGS